MRRWLVSRPVVAQGDGYRTLWQVEVRLRLLILLLVLLPILLLILLLVLLLTSLLQLLRDVLFSVLLEVAGLGRRGGRDLAILSGRHHTPQGPPVEHQHSGAPLQTRVTSLTLPIAVAGLAQGDVAVGVVVAKS